MIQTPNSYVPSAGFNTHLTPNLSFFWSRPWEVPAMAHMIESLPLIQISVLNSWYLTLSQSQTVVDTWGLNQWGKFISLPLLSFLLSFFSLINTFKKESIAVISESLAPEGWLDLARNVTATLMGISQSLKGLGSGKARILRGKGLMCLSNSRESICSSQQIHPFQNNWAAKISHTRRCFCWCCHIWILRCNWDLFY